MKIRWHGMLGTNHSWSFVSQALARSMAKMGHEVNMKSTNGLEHFPEDLKQYLDPGVHEQKPNVPINEQDLKRPYDLELAYTVNYQFPRRFFSETKCKMGIWNFESSILSAGWNHYVNSIDYILPSSQFSSDIFTNNGISKDKCVVVPHGVYTDMFNPDIPPFKLKTEKKVKLLINAIPHARKNIDKAINAYLDTFTCDDDICLVLKTRFITPTKEKPFEVDVKQFLTDAFRGRSNPPEIEVITTFIPDIGSLYTACDAVICTSSTEGFCLKPGVVVDTDSGLKKIEDIKVNDLVIGCDGKEEKVTGVTKRKVNEKLVSIKRKGCSEYFTGTSDHPHLAIRRKKFKFSYYDKKIQNGAILPKWTELGKLKKGDFVSIPKPKFKKEKIDYLYISDFVDVEQNGDHVFLKNSFRKKSEFSITKISKILNCSFQYVSEVLNDENKKSKLAKQIRKCAEDYLYQKSEHIVINNKILLDEKFAEVLGLYIAEGSVTARGNAIDFSSHSKEQWAHQRESDVLISIFNSSVSKILRENKCNIVGTNKIAASFFKNLCGSSAISKKIPKFLYQSNFMVPILRGIFYGDGSCSNSAYSFSTSSDKLAKQIYQFLLSENIFCSIGLDKRKDNINYIITVSKRYNKRFFNLIKPIKYSKEIELENSIRNSSCVENKDFFFVPITDIKTENYNGFVHNCHVESSESYTSYGMVTHNCLPLLEGMACGTQIVSPRYGGQLEFLNDDNSILYDVGEMYAPLEHQYWTYHPKSIVGDISEESISEAMRKVYDNLETEKERTANPIKKTVEKFNWDDANKIIMDLAESHLTSHKPKKREVLHIIPYGMVGGAEVWVKNAIENLNDEYESKVVLVMPTPELENFFANYDIIKLTNENRFEELKCFIEGAGEIIHFYNSLSVFATIKRSWDEGFRKRVLETHHSNLMWGDSINKISKRSPIVSAIISVSFDEVNSLQKKGNPYVFYLPQQINWDNFKPSEGSLKKDLKINGPLVGTVARFSPEKNINMVINCARKMSDVDFVIVGEGPQKDIIKKMTKSIKNLHILDFTNDVSNIYNSLDVFFLPSKMEGVPLTILEAMSCGVPVVSSDVGNIKEIIVDDINGYINKNINNTSDFVQLLNKALDNRERLSKDVLNFIKGYREKDTNISDIYGRLYK